MDKRPKCIICGKATQSVSVCLFGKYYHKGCASKNLKRKFTYAKKNIALPVEI